MFAVRTMYIPVAKSCAVREAGGPEYKRHHQTVLREFGDSIPDYKRNNFSDLIENGDEKLNTAIQIQVSQCKW